jgi:hypothetical protein
VRGESSLSLLFVHVGNGFVLFLGCLVLCQMIALCAGDLRCVNFLFLISLSLLMFLFFLFILCIRTCLVSAPSHVRLLILVYFVHHCIWGSSISVHFVCLCLLGWCEQFVVCGVASANHILYVLCAITSASFCAPSPVSSYCNAIWQAA